MCENIPNTYHNTYHNTNPIQTNTISNTIQLPIKTNTNSIIFNTYCSTCQYTGRHCYTASTGCSPASSSTSVSGVSENYLPRHTRPGQQNQPRPLGHRLTVAQCFVTTKLSTHQQIPQALLWRNEAS